MSYNLQTASSTNQRLLDNVTRLLEEGAVQAVPALGGITEMLSTSDFSPDVDALAEHARSCVVALVQRGNPADMRTASLALFERLAINGKDIPPEYSDPALLAMIQEWARIPAAAAQLRGSSAVDQVLRGFKGRVEVVLGIVARAAGVLTRQAIVEALQALGHDLGDTSGVSHILRGLEDADLVLRWSEGRTTMIEVTPEGLAVATERGLRARELTETSEEIASATLATTTSEGKLSNRPSGAPQPNNSVSGSPEETQQETAASWRRRNCAMFVRVEIPHQNPNTSRNLRSTSSSRIAALSGSRS
jgi:hypothetical protein